MKSRTSFFNRGLSLSLLRRSWPVWTSYFALLFLIVPANLMSMAQSREYQTAESVKHLGYRLNREMLYAGENMVILSFFACILVAMAMYSFMYNNRSTSMYCSLPIKRETVFSTAFITGIVPMLIADVLVALICLVFLCGENMMDVKSVWTFLAMAVMSNICFFGFASFCAVLTGNLFVLPAVYGVLNIAVILAEAGINGALNVIVYGYTYNGDSFAFLSPIAQLMNSIQVETVYTRLIDGGMQDTGNYIFHGMEVMAIYCAVGLVFAVFGLLLYRRRKMETVSDVVSIPVLKPIFKYCMCFGVALMLSWLLYEYIFSRSLSAATEAAAYGAMMLLGAFIGYFVSEMLMQKTLRVFRGKWKGFIVSCALIIAFVAAVELDLTGYEKRLPELDGVEFVELSYYSGAQLHEEENIRAVYDFHRQLIDSKAVNESSDHVNQIYISYRYPDGSYFSRQYPVSFELSEKRDPASPVNTLGRIINCNEAIMARVTTVVPATEYNIVDAYFSSERIREDGEREYYSYALSPAQAADFYNNCILPDAMDGKLSRVFPVENEEYFSQASTTSFSFSIFNNESNLDEWYRNYYDFNMYLDAQRCVEWIEENTDIELVSIGERDPEYRDKVLNELETDMERPIVTAATAVIIPAPAPMPR